MKYETQNGIIDVDETKSTRVAHFHAAIGHKHIELVASSNKIIWIYEKFTNRFSVMEFILNAPLPRSTGSHGVKEYTYSTRMIQSNEFYYREYD